MKAQRKFKRKTLRQWAAFARRGAKRGTYAHDHHLHAFEDEVILRKMQESGETSARALAGRYPELFNPRLLPRTMKRMARQGKLEPLGRSRWARGQTYRPRGVVVDGERKSA